MKIGAVLLFFSVLAIAALGEAASPPIRGIYALTPPNPSPSQIPNSVLTNPYVDGIALRVGWSTLEPGLRIYQWTEIDSIISLAASHGKTVSISVEAGIDSPTWLYSQGAQSYKFMWDLPWGPEICTVARIPIPWDSIFQARWAEFVEALGSRYGSNSRVTFVKLTGLNSKTEETFLPNATGGQPVNGGKCRSMNDVQDWLNVGYTRTKVENAWLAIANDFDRAFPNREFAAMLLPGGFPPIDGSGYLIPNASCDYQVTGDILNDGITYYGRGEFAAQNNGLSNTWIWLALVNSAPMIDTGFQTTAPMGAALGQALNLAIQGSADYLEIYLGDLTDPSLQGVIKQAHVALLGH